MRGGMGLRHGLKRRQRWPPTPAPCLSPHLQLWLRLARWQCIHIVYDLRALQHPASWRGSAGCNVFGIGQGRGCLAGVQLIYARVPIFTRHCCRESFLLISCRAQTGTKKNDRIEMQAVLTPPAAVPVLLSKPKARRVDNGEWALCFEGPGSSCMGHWEVMWHVQHILAAHALRCPPPILCHYF